MKLVILAGGKGKRMGLMTKLIPKPMAMLAGKKILEHQLEFARRYNLTDIIILTGYREDVIKNYFKNGKKWGINIQYYSDPFPLGTAGAVKNIDKELTEDFILFYGDTIMDVDLHLLVQFHKEKNSIATLVAHPNDHPHDSDLLDIDENNRIKAFYSKPHIQETYHRNLVNAALYVLKPDIFEHIVKDTSSDFGKDIFPKLISMNKSLYAYNTTEYIKDIGTAKRIKEVEIDYLSGKVHRLNRSNTQKAVFIDRDGVINYENEPLNIPNKLKLLSGVEEAILTLNKSDYLAVVVTNQPIIAKGFATEKQVGEVHNYMENILGKEGAYLNRIYYCPHHPEKGFDGERKEFKISCKCRKPDTGMIDSAATDMNIDLNRSFIIGDRSVDIMTGINSKLHTILVRQGYAGDDMKYTCRPDFIFKDLLEASQFIVYGYDNLFNKMKAILTTRILKGNENPKIIVGGLSRSGKSTLSAVICNHFAQVGRKVITLNLDNWLLSKDQRSSGMCVRDRYRYEAIENDIKALFDGKQININRYDSQTRKIIKNANKFLMSPGDILLIDGVIALDHQYIRGITDVSFYTHVNEKLRKNRFYDFYYYKSLSEREIDSLYKTRIEDEVEIIEQSKGYAHHIINMDY